MSTKQTEPKDPVVAAERALAEAQEALHKNLEEQQQRTKAVAELEEALGETPDGKDVLRSGAMIAVHTARLKRLARDERVLHQAVTAAEAGLKQAEITGQDKTLDRLNGMIIEGLATMLKRIEEHEAVVSARDALAHAHDLPTPGRRRFLFTAPVLRSRGCELLRDRLDLRHALGGIQVKPAEGLPSVGFVPG